MPIISSFKSATLNNLVDRYNSSHTGGHNNRSAALDLISRANKTTNATYNTANKSQAAFNSMSAATGTTATNNASSSDKTMPQPTIDYKQLVMSMSASGTSPRHSFQRATISSAAKTRAFNESLHLQQSNNTSSQHSSQSHTPSPQSTPTLLRSRSLRMSSKYQNTTHYYRTSKTPELHSFNSSDISNSSHDSQVVKHIESKINELKNERKELKENCEFLERERLVLNETLKEVEESLENEKTQWKIEKYQLETRLNELAADKALLEDKLRSKEMEVAWLIQRKERAIMDLEKANQQIELVEKELGSSRELLEERNLNDKKQQLPTPSNSGECSTTNGLKVDHTIQTDDYPENAQLEAECAKLRTEIKVRDQTIEELNKRYDRHRQVFESNEKRALEEIQVLDKMIDQTIDTIKSWPKALLDDPNVKNLLHVLSIDKDDLGERQNP